MEISLYNSLTNNKEIFAPIKKGQVGMYHCGPTVYNYPHIGNLRHFVLADLLRRLFEYNDYKIKQVINITDVGHIVGDVDEGEDKIEKSAKAEKKTSKEIADFYTKIFFEDLGFLNINVDKTIFSKATDHIKEQIELIQRLEDSGFTYRTSDGVYFDTKKFKNYGKLGNIDIEGLKEGARVAINPEKRNPTDFALWKFSPKGVARELEWESPWGKGFPGWHIECSAMSMKYLGETFDIHTGGIDLIPTHHNGEIAQSEGATGKKFVNYWIHNAFVNFGEEKMSKSKGTFIRIEDLIKKGFNPLSYRYLLLGSHYRTPMNFSMEAFEGAQNSYSKLTRFIGSSKEVGKINSDYKVKFTESINDDLNTSEALSIVWRLVKDDNVPLADKRTTLLDFDRVLGLGLNKVIEEKIPKEIEDLVNQRETERKTKNYKKSDELRKAIENAGYSLEDSTGGPKVSKK